jgi:hypothetical protein
LSYNLTSSAIISIVNFADIDHSIKIRNGMIQILSHLGGS